MREIGAKQLAMRWWRSVAEMAGIVLLVMLAKAAIAEPYYVPSGSMEPTLLIGDELLAAKYAYGYGAASLPFGIVPPGRERLFAAMPARGDIVVFRAPHDPSEVWVKRVIGLPGDHVQMRAGRLWLNGKPVAMRPTGETEDDDGANAPGTRFIETLPGGVEHRILKLTQYGALNNTPEVAVPPGHLFVMGDNRDNSADSRVAVADGGVGLLPVGNLIGRVNVLVGSWDLAMKDQPLWTWPSGLRLSRFFSAVR